MLSVMMGGKRKEGSKLDLAKLLMGVILVGIVLRVVTFWSGYMFWDAPYYVQMGKSFANGENLLLPWGNPFLSGEAFVEGPSHHFSPLFPMYLGTFYAAFGYSPGLTRALSILLSCIFLLVIYLTSKDLLSKDKALVITAMFSLDPHLIMTTRDIMPENMILIFFVLTIWAIVRAIKDDRYMILAALFAGASYLTKSSVGYLFIIAGVGGFAWRFYYIKWEVFKRKWYLTAIAIFLGLVAAWSWRNIKAFGWFNWQTSPYLDEALMVTVRQPADFLKALLISIPFFVAIVLMYAAYWLPWARKSLRKVRTERTSAMWLAVGLVIVISLWFSAALAIFEGTDLWTHSFLRVRYMVLAFPPLLWAVMDEIGDLRLDRPIRAGSVGRFFKDMGKVLRSLNRRRSRAAAIGIAMVGGVLLLMVDPVYMLMAVMLFGGGLGLLFLDPRKVLVVMLVFFLVPAVEMSTQRAVVAEVELAKDLDRLVQEGQTVYLDGSNIDIGYMYVGLDDIDFDMTNEDVAGGGDLIISYDLGAQYPGYNLVKVYDDKVTVGVVKGVAYKALGRDTTVSEPKVALWERA
jgi:4-amino-4-deoxy-L-arabinose transferase-like glycosyltransferase